MICILEDNDDRIRRFRAAAANIGGDIDVRVWKSAAAMIAELPDYLEQVTLISLDHDLNPLAESADDPGCGYDVVKVLEQLNPFCPVIVHTSNVERGTWMEGGLSLGGWTYQRVAPIGDDWIETAWAPSVRTLLNRPGA